MHCSEPGYADPDRHRRRSSVDSVSVNQGRQGQRWPSESEQGAGNARYPTNPPLGPSKDRWPRQSEWNPQDCPPQPQMIGPDWTQPAYAYACYTAPSDFEPRRGSIDSRKASIDSRRSSIDSSHPRQGSFSSNQQEPWRPTPIGHRTLPRRPR